MANNYNIMADYIVTKYIERISGDDLEEVFVEDNPAERVMVGMLAENRVEESFSGGYIENNNTRFESIPSISITFIVRKNKSGVLYVIPKGLLFYTIEPNYNMTCDYIIQKFSERDNIHYTGITQLLDRYPTEKFWLPLTYKKVSLQDEFKDGIAIRLDSIRGKKFNLEQEISDRLAYLANRILSEICIIQCDRISFCDMINEDRFRMVTGRKDERALPRWRVDISCVVSDEGDNYRFLLQMVNKTPVEGKKNIGYLPKIFNAGIKLVGNENVEFIDIKLEHFKNSFKQRPLVYVVSENTSASYDKKTNTITTEHIPKYYQKRLKTKEHYNGYISFEKLITDPVGNLMFIYNKMQDDYTKCENEYKTTKFTSEVAKEKFKDALEEYQCEINRFRKGIEQIEYKDYVRKAFIYMNKTFQTKLDGERRNIIGWRLFQIVFIVSLVCKMIRSEYKEDQSIIEADIEEADLLFFPTGGGKTEAFLGACIFVMFFDRLRGKNEGISALIKYPLRLLAVQQLDRVLTIVMKANVQLLASAEMSNYNPFQVGFYVGQNNTPNKIDENEKLSSRGDKDKHSSLIMECDQELLNESYRFIDTCPYCGEKEVNVRFNKETWKLEHYCSNQNCSVDVLPLLIVDSEIYRYLPSIVVSTIDKMAMVGTTNEFKMFFGQVKKKCPVHGFSAGTDCICSGCGHSSSVKKVGLLKDPVPTLFIQDEMHLVKESLGTFNAHYESFIKYYAKELVPIEQRKQIRYIGATATISMYKEHIRNLYHMSGRRFPCEYPSIKHGENFYSYTDENDITRITLGYAPYGRSITDGMWESVYIMRLITYRMIRNDETYNELCELGFEGTLEEYKDRLYDYWVELVYNNRKQDAMELQNAFQNQGNNYLEAKGVPKFVIAQMTSDEDFQDVRKTLFNIQANRRDFKSTNLLLATSTISHGVDEDSFNLMYFFGMPNNNAEYVQAYSRAGRKYTGIIIDIIRLMRVRDRSYLKNFVVFHQNQEELIEPVPVNRWAKNAVYSTLPGLLSGLIMQYYTTKTNTDSLYQAVKVKKLLLDGNIDIDEASLKLIEAYGCNEQEKMSIAYKEIISEETYNILSGIKNGNFSTSDFLSDAISKFSRGKKKPMTSLRDTEELIEIKI